MREETGNSGFNYEIASTEICGKGHFTMKMNVVVHTIEEFEAWKKTQEAWLKQNPAYLEKVPAGLREAAMISAGIPLESLSTAAQNVTQTISVN